jgi:hypothetical protein
MPYNETQIKVFNIKNGQTIDRRAPGNAATRRKAHEDGKARGVSVPVFSDYEVVYSLPEIKDEIKVLVTAGSPIMASDAAQSEIAKTAPTLARDKSKLIWKSTRRID